MLLERERTSQLYSRRHEFRKVFCALEEAEVKLSQQRKAESKRHVHVHTCIVSLGTCIHLPRHCQPHKMVVKLDAVG